MVTFYDYKQYILYKDIFLQFAKQFAKENLTPYDLLVHNKNLLEAIPILTNYAYQLALSVCHKHTIFNTLELELVFNHRFKIIDTYGMNGYNCDVSTLNTAFIANHISRHTPFKNIQLAILNAPLEYKTKQYKRIQGLEPTKTFVEKAIDQTGQPNNDLQMNVRSYDIKHTQKTTAYYNHILPWTFERVESSGKQHLNNIYDQLLKKPHIMQTLSQIKNDNNVNIHQKFKYWNTFLNENWTYIEHYNIKLPLVIQMTTIPFTPVMPKTMHDLLHIPPNLMENELAVRRAIANSISIVYKKDAAQILANAAKMTNNMISSKLLDNYSLDDVD
jgi:hypothetical protein